MDHKLFVSSEKSMLIAPAGHGKTHAITDCLIHTAGKQLILTHTHAGIASIKEKIKKASIPQRKYHIETITGYAQKYVRAFYSGADIPDQKDTHVYYNFLIYAATRLLRKPLIIGSIKASYTGLFVDEYQDCTLDQHNLISCLSSILPTRILGDPLQGIFGFKDSLMVDLNNSLHTGDYQSNQQRLNEPWRWKGKNEELGKTLIKIREKIEAKQQIDLREHSSVIVNVVKASKDLYLPTEPYYKSVSKLLSEKNLLLIHPISSSANVRLKIISLFKAPITLVEAIDDQDFYTIARIFDTLNNENVVEIVIGICLKLFNKAGVKIWFNDKGLIRKSKPEEQIVSSEIKEILDKVKTNSSLSDIAQFLKHIDSLKTIRCYRREMLNAVCASLTMAESKKITVSESMIESRNHTRRVGRKVHGRCIGTTLLTKGLEFDTVVILNADDFKCPKNLYVALTRASKKLIIFTTNPILTPTY